uniref:Uncharacterized protein n=1 Tax=Coturnix japonica TaxID=93934 RepID=A0A8C2STY6_COTJA
MSATAGRWMRSVPCRGPAINFEATRISCTSRRNTATTGGSARLVKERGDIAFIPSPQRLEAVRLKQEQKARRAGNAPGIGDSGSRRSPPPY